MLKNLLGSPTKKNAAAAGSEEAKDQVVEQRPVFQPIITTEAEEEGKQADGEQFHLAPADQLMKASTQTFIEFLISMDQT